MGQPPASLTPDAIARAYANTSELSPTDRLKLLRLLIELGGDYLAPVLLAAMLFVSSAPRWVAVRAFDGTVVLTKQANRHRSLMVLLVALVALAAALWWAWPANDTLLAGPDGRGGP